MVSKITNLRASSCGYEAPRCSKIVYLNSPGHWYKRPATQMVAGQVASYNVLCVLRPCVHNSTPYGVRLGSQTGAGLCLLKLWPSAGVGLGLLPQDYRFHGCWLSELDEDNEPAVRRAMRERLIGATF